MHSLRPAAFRIQDADLPAQPLSDAVSPSCCSIMGGFPLAGILKLLAGGLVSIDNRPDNGIGLDYSSGSLAAGRAHQERTLAHPRMRS
jgi:hypothetical protein